MDIYDELRGLLAALEKQRVDYAICGGIALALHGYPRLTKDLLDVKKLESRDAEDAEPPLGETS